MNHDLDYVMFTPEELHARVQEIGKALTQEYAGKAPILLCIMKGSLVFTADLMREINLPCTLEYITLSSYRAMATRPGELTMSEPFDVDVTGRDIIVVEDILDTGRTLSFVMGLLKGQNPASLKLVVLLDKPSRREAPVEADIVGFTIPDAFVVGYGLDYDQKYRNLPCIGVLKPSVYGG
jgi:hypoxanthine phosphoribosyltransferase